jgi:hypothetical protein
LVNLTPTISLLEALWSSQSIAGIIVTIWAAWDGWLDFRASRADLQLGLITAADHWADFKTAMIGILAALGGMIAHCLFLSLGVLGATLPPPPPNRAVASLVTGLIFLMMQTVMLVCQIGVQLLRRSLRHRPNSQGEPAHVQ